MLRNSLLGIYPKKITGQVYKDMFVAKTGNYLMDNYWKLVKFL